MRRACARTLSPRSFFLLVLRLQPTPSPLCGLASWPLLDACSMFSRGVIPDFLTRLCVELSFEDDEGTAEVLELKKTGF